MSYAITTSRLSLIQAPFQVVVSWPGRLLTWLYPARAMGGVQGTLDLGRRADEAKRPRPTPGKPARLRTGESRK